MAAFAALGFFFPVLVTLLTYASNDRLGPAITSTVSATAPFFALLAAVLFIGERIPAHALLATCGVVGGIALVSWRGAAPGRGAASWALAIPVAGAVVRGFAQAAVKAGLALWPSPFAATLIGYTVSSAVALGVGRASTAPRRGPALFWFALTGVLNGAGVLALYSALGMAPVSLVAPIAGTYPLVTLLITAVFLREERITPAVVLGGALTVSSIAYLVSG